MNIRPLRRRRWLRAAPLLVAGICLHAAEPAPISLYDKDPNHVWNRLYSALMARAPEPDAVVNDLLDPPFWHNTKHLRDGETNRAAVVLLAEFVNGQPRPDSMSALQRAVKQRDLLWIFHWLAHHNRGPKNEWPTPERELAGALVRAIRSVALTPEEIRKLPDNYALAFKSPDIVTAFNAANPAPFLPKDLLADDGPWIALEPPNDGGDDGLAATVHFMAFFGRSAFEVRMRHPEGRAAGEAYLKQLAAMPEPLVKEKPAAPIAVFGQDRGPWVNPATPQFPPGTVWALVRRAVLADTSGLPVVSPLVTSVQIRVYRSMDSSPGEGQTFFEWETRRALLLGKGGFHLTTPLDQLYAYFPGALHGRADPIEASHRKQDSLHRKQDPLNCFVCHMGPGIHSVQSRLRVFESEVLARPPEFLAVNRARIDEITAARARPLKEWKLLQSRWEDPSEW
jgi:hypothetical protein